MCEFPQIGFGTWKFKNTAETTAVIREAAATGYRLFDTASSYGNEEAIGNALCNQDRECLIVSGKLWNTDRDKVKEACQKTIERLQCGYLDIYLVHWPASKAVHEDWELINQRVWQQMEQLVQEGMVRHIGVSNFKVNQLEALLRTAKIKPFVNQIEIHPGFRQQEIVDYCRERGIMIQAWSPLGSGRILKKQEVRQIAEKYGKTPAQLCLRWSRQNGLIPIVKSADQDRMKENLLSETFQISAEDMAYLNALPYLGGSGLDSETITLFG